MLTILIVSIVLSGCGLGAQSSRIQRTPAPADRVDPFEYGDEFQVSANPAEGTSPAPADSVQAGSSPAGQSRNTQAQTATPAPPVAGSTGTTLYQIQLSGVFEDKNEADSFANKARQKLDSPITVEYRAPFYRVFNGSFSSQKEAESYVVILKQKGFSDSRWILNTSSP